MAHDRLFASSTDWFSWLAPRYGVTRRAIIVAIVAGAVTTALAVSAHFPTRTPPQAHATGS
jgi:hypothetical protein